MLLLKNLQFLPNDYETRTKLSTHEYLILAEFHNDWVKIVDFILIAYFWASVIFSMSRISKVSDKKNC